MVTCLDFMPHMRQHRITLPDNQVEGFVSSNIEEIKPGEVFFSNKGISCTLVPPQVWERTSIKRDNAQLYNELQLYIRRIQDDKYIISNEAKSKLLWTISRLDPSFFSKVLLLLNKETVYRDILSLFILKGEHKTFLKFYTALSRVQKKSLWQLFKEELVRLKRLEAKLLTCFRRFKEPKQKKMSVDYNSCLKDLFKQVLLLTTWSRIPIFLYSFEEGEVEVFDTGLKIHSEYKQFFTSNFMFLGQIRSFFTRYQSEDSLSDIEPITLICSN